MTPAAAARGICDSVLSVAWAPQCASCHRLLDEPTRGIVCVDCWRHLPRITPPVCDRCGSPRPSQQPAGVGCGLCRNTPELARRRSAGLYHGTLRAIIHAFKYQGRESLARPLAELMRAAGRDLLSDADWVVPVPLHATRRWSRGFNQAAALAGRLGPPVADALRRNRPTPPQARLSAVERHRNVRDAFELRRGTLVQPFSRIIAGCTIVVIDDVSTTGATLEACAEVLRRAGANDVRALTAAAAIREDRQPVTPPRRQVVPRRRAATSGGPPVGDSSL